MDYPCSGFNRLEDGRAVTCGKSAVAFPIGGWGGYCPDHFPGGRKLIRPEAGTPPTDGLLAACKALIAADGPTGLSFTAAQAALRLAREAVAKAEGREG